MAKSPAGRHENILTNPSNTFKKRLVPDTPTIEILRNSKRASEIVYLMQPNYARQPKSQCQNANPQRRECLILERGRVYRKQKYDGTIVLEHNIVLRVLCSTM